jgi:hypothetical protein
MRVFPAVSLWDSPYLHPIEIDIVNNGGKTWKVDETPHRLVIEPGTLLWDFSDVASPIGLRSFVPLPREVKPGELVTFKFVARWHDYGGPNTFNVKMTEEGVETFGESCRTMVDVFDEGDTP